jgi:hypothetical protein
MKRLFLAAVSATAGLHAVTFGQPDGSKQAVAQNFLRTYIP